MKEWKIKQHKQIQRIAIKTKRIPRTRRKVQWFEIGFTSLVTLAVDGHQWLMVLTLAKVGGGVGGGVLC